MATLWDDVRSGFGTLARNPGFSAVVAAILALGIGATTAILSVMNAVLLHGLPYARPDRLMLLAGALSRGGAVEAMPISYIDFADWRRAEGLFAGLAAYSDRQSFNLLVGDEAEHVGGELVTAGYFQTLGVAPVAGRTFTAEEDGAPGAHRVVVVGHELWRSALGGDRALVGRDLVLNGESYRVVGVLPPGFHGLTDGADLWLPMAMAAEVMSPEFLELRRFRWLSAVGRLAPGVSPGQAQAAMDAVTGRLAREYPDTNQGVGVRLTPLAEAWFGDLRRKLAALLGGAAFVLLIACTNIAGLLLARALARRREVTIRAALGAGRARLLRQLLVESLLLSLLGGLVGLLAARWATRALLAASAAQFKSFIRVGLDPPVAAASLALALLCGLAFGLAPAWVAARGDLAGVLKEGGKGAAAGGRRGQSLLVVGEIALALALLIGAGLMVRGLRELRATDLGFRPAELLTLRVYLAGDRYTGAPAVWQLARELRERLAALPGVAAVALGGPGAPTDDWYGADFALEEPPDPRAENRTLLFVHNVGPGYFSTLGVPLLKGRDFGLGDDETAAPAVIVSVALAVRSWPGRDPLGKGLRFFRDGADAPWFRVVGVVGDVRQRGLASSPVEAPDVYFPLLQRPPWSPPVLNFFMRPAGGGSALALAPAVRREIRAAVPDLPVYDVATMAERLDRQTAQARFLVLLMGLFAGAAALLATLGLYSLVSYSVLQLRRAIGVRLALGAGRGDVLRLVLGRAAGLALAGIALGLAGAFALTRVLANALYGVSATDLATFAVTSLLLLLVTLAASAVPALRAVRVDPLDVLRTE